MVETRLLGLKPGGLKTWLIGIFLLGLGVSEVHIMSERSRRLTIDITIVGHRLIIEVVLKVRPRAVPLEKRCELKGRFCS